MNGTGRVVSIDNGKAQISMTASESCAGCAIRNQCHSASSNTRTVTVVNAMNARPGDTVVFEVDPSRVVMSAVLVLIMPLILMIAGYLVAEQFADGIIPIIAAFVCFGISFLLIKIIDRAVSDKTSFYPVITEIIDNPPVGDSSCHN
jgi:sigma-E factor negative regulatory protein RseC